MSLRPDQFAALCEGSLRELLRIDAAARDKEGSSLVADALATCGTGQLAVEWIRAVQRARQLLANKP